MVTRVAFLGLGHMGLPMARNLVAAGYDVIGFDVVPAAVDAARAADIPIAESGIAAASDADVVLTMFPSGRHVIDAYENGLLAAARADTLFIDSSTIAVDEAQTAHELALAAGHRSIDAPVSGGVVGAENGTLAFMVGGSEEDFASALPLLEVMGRRIVHCGGPGLGQAAKVCNNMILAVSQIAVAEAFVLGERLGLTHQALYDVASNASGQCWALSTNCPVPGPVPTSPANRDYQPGFAGALMAKDLGLALQAIEGTGTDARMGRLAQELYAAFAAGDGASRDFSGIITDIREGTV
ncbi:3-hydroxyisobutyrate dehydrogenase [Microbacterium keratanolyticum]|uniref:3-hydroxyisobutyrate dehydrogenase n=1 Tax=Microbacterium keratanolyticum TaxID=67574 RepID=A0A9W6HRF6_9MICO|nr:3-hydroxyisobutyrate dehydrogenase [Microbacterium keratanolyticum]MBM7469209.1 3-hydroxyisobutyrate dehydrogenase [Microbacterium keratanolyticum]GLK01289.1 3-hydroxyisobutyrate dehydrogenase [Microbacterium keratanolyticum]